MNHIELITSIRAELGNGNHLDAWELALSSQDAVALAYVDAHAPITIAAGACDSDEYWCPCKEAGPNASTLYIHGQCIATFRPSRGYCMLQWHGPRVCFAGRPAAPVLFAQVVYMVSVMNGRETHLDHSTESFVFWKVQEP